MTDRRPLTARTPIRAWLADPVGGPLLGGLLGVLGTEPARLGPVSGYPLAELADLSQGRVTSDQIDQLVRTANGGERVDEPDAAPAASDGVVREGLTLADIQIRDPFVLVHDGTYHLYGSTDRNIWFGAGTGFDTYRSADLVTWAGPVPAFRPPAGFWSPGRFWAPEVHAHAGRFFMFATFTDHDGHLGTAILVAETPEGPFQPWSDGPVTPPRWQCLDATFHVDASGDPWMVFCQEWTQIHDGAIWAQRLAADLRQAVGAPVFLFNASEAAWSKPLSNPRTEALAYPVHVTDGPFLFRLASGHLVMLWSSFGDDGYAMGVAHSTTGTVSGPWTQEEAPIWAADGGHGMIVRLLDGTLALTLHQPNASPDERAVIRRLVEHETTVTLAPGTGPRATAGGPALDHGLPPLPSPAPGRDAYGRTPRPPLDPSVAVAVSELPAAAVRPADIPALRARPHETPESLAAAYGVVHRELQATAADGHRIPLAVFRRAGDEAVGPGFVAIHGGGMIVGERWGGAGTFLPDLVAHGGTLVSIGYRLAPEHPAPTPVEDCYAALAWVADHVDDLLIDPARLLLGGGSAGGGLAAGVMLLARDRGGPALAGVLLACPMLDDRNDSVSIRQFDLAAAWCGQSNAVGWGALLGAARGTDAVSPYDAPGRAPWLGDLPPLHVSVGSADPFRDEDVAFASAVWRDGGDCELYVLPGGNHGYESGAPASSITAMTELARRRWVTRILRPDDTTGVVPLAPAVVREPDADAPS